MMIDSYHGFTGKAGINIEILACHIAQILQPKKIRNERLSNTTLGLSGDLLRLRQSQVRPVVELSSNHM